MLTTHLRPLCLGRNMGNESSASAQAPGADEEKLRAIQRMDASLRRKLRGGVNYNMKVVIRGERHSGKTSLLQRLQGHSFDPTVSEHFPPPCRLTSPTEIVMTHHNDGMPQYDPSPEIRTATINWSFKNMEDLIKVEVWDVVDKGLRLKPGVTARDVLQQQGGLCLIITRHTSPWGG
jgi:hypothetical protein